MSSWMNILYIHQTKCLKRIQKKKVTILHVNRNLQKNTYIIAFNSYFKCIEKIPERNIQDYS